MEVKHMKQVQHLLATAILRAQELREKSWVNDKSSYGGHYDVQEIDAANEACIQLGIQPFYKLVYYLNRAYWNDVQEWCNETLKG